MASKRCSTCHLFRPLTDFNVRRAAADGRQSRCRDCFRAWYQLNNAEHKKNVAARNRRVRGEHARRLAEYLLEHSCVDCGEDDVRVLDFDHEDPSLKEWNIGRLTGMAMPWSRADRATQAKERLTALQLGR